MSDTKKMPPLCPDCGHEMKTAGQLRTERKVKKLFQCMAIGCKSHGTYTRKGERLTMQVNP